MVETRMLGRSSVSVPAIGLGVMTWGEARGFHRVMPAKAAYGGANSVGICWARPSTQPWRPTSTSSTRRRCTAAARPSVGWESWRSPGDVVIATKFPPSPMARAEDMPAALDASLSRLRRQSVDLYQHHFPSRRVDIPTLMGLMADAVEAGKIRAVQ